MKKKTTNEPVAGQSKLIAWVKSNPRLSAILAFALLATIAILGSREYSKKDVVSANQVQTTDEKKQESSELTRISQLQETVSKLTTENVSLQKQVKTWYKKWKDLDGTEHEEGGTDETSEMVSSLSEQLTDLRSQLAQERDAKDLLATKRDTLEVQLLRSTEELKRSARKMTVLLGYELGQVDFSSKNLNGGALLDFGPLGVGMTVSPARMVKTDGLSLDGTIAWATLSL